MVYGVEVYVEELCFYWFIGSEVVLYCIDVFECVIDVGCIYFDGYFVEGVWWDYEYCWVVFLVYWGEVYFVGDVDYGGFD